MKNILFLTATPTVGGNGDALIGAAMEEAKEHGAKVHLIHIREKRIGFCNLYKPYSTKRRYGEVLEET